MIVTEPIESNGIPMATLVDMPFMGTSNYEYYGDIIPKLFALARAGQHDEAMTRYREALTLNPRYVSALNNLGSSLARQDRFADAVKLLREMKRKFNSRDWDELIAEVERRLERK